MDDIFEQHSFDYATPEPLIGWLHSRDRMDLSGEWNIIVDPMGAGDPGVVFGGFDLNRKTVDGMELIEYDFEASPTLRVPGDWNTQEERLLFYQGPIWYHRIIILTGPVEGRKHLYFGAVNFHAAVFLNGRPIGVHIGGYVPFSFDVTDVLREGENTIQVRVDNRLGKSTIPTNRIDWWPYGGLIRKVELLSMPTGFVRNAQVGMGRNGEGIEASVETCGMPSGTQGRLSVEGVGTAEFEIGPDGTARTQITASPPHWSPTNPTLTQVTIEVGEDVVSDQIGFRTIRRDGGTILLNDEPIRFRGICMHEEPIDDDGVAWSEAHYRRLLEEAKALGANFIRAAHYPYGEDFARLADEMGIMLWEEVPLYWGIDWDNDATYQVASDQLDRLVRRDWNRASVVVWSVANETLPTEQRTTFLRKLIGELRALDESRLVSAALLGNLHSLFDSVTVHLAVRGLNDPGLKSSERAVLEGVVANAGTDAPAATDGLILEVNDPLADDVDLVALNQYLGWYYSILFSKALGVRESILRPAFLDLIRRTTIISPTGKPIHASEFGAGAKAGKHDSEETIWSEEYQAAVYDAQFTMLANSDSVQGITPWLLTDFRSPMRPLAGVQDYYNRKGLMDENGIRKMAYDTVRSFYLKW